jgi:alpha-ketoglutarate-dependent taurine dioxygenase
MSDTLIKAPLQLSGVLDQYDSFDVTPIIGREFPTANLKEWLQAANSDALLRDLAITVSQRGVVFFRKQDDIDDDLQKELAQRLGELSGKPKTSGLHIHPILNSSREMGGDDERISILSREMERTQWNEMIEPGKRQSAIIEWHNDITFEVCPSDYAVLRLTELPKCGGGQYCYLSRFIDTHGLSLSFSSELMNWHLRHSLGLRLRAMIGSPSHTKNSCSL